MPRFSAYKHLICLLALSFVLVSFMTIDAATAGFWTLKYGSKSSEVSYYNNKVKKPFEEATPMGPLAFRIINGELWVADSIGGKIIVMAADGKIKATIKVPGIGSDTLLEDLAPVIGRSKNVDAVWVADGADLIVRKLSVPAGKEILKVGGRGEAAGEFLQIHQIEVGPTGRLYVGDYGRSTISVFSEKGEFLWECPWERSGFAVDEKEHLSTIIYIDGTGYVRQRFDTYGKLESSLHIGLPMLQNPRLWWLAPDGAMHISFIPAGGFRGLLTMYVISPDGAVLKKYNVRPTQGMNRFIDNEGGNLWVAKADFGAAPAGAFQVEPLIVKQEPVSDKNKKLEQWSALKISRQLVAKISNCAVDDVIGIHAAGNIAFLSSRSGQFAKIDLENGKVGEWEYVSPSKNEILDCALIAGNPVAIDKAGKLVGAKPVKWPEGPFYACKIEANNGDALLSGASSSIYLSEKLDKAIAIQSAYLASPMRDGFLWQLQHIESRPWEALLIDAYGNVMKHVFRFGPAFEPTGIAFGPLGPEGELLISYFNGDSREVVLLAQNGKMLWKLPLNAPAVPRDLAWDAKGNLLVLELEEGHLVLNRINFAVPEG